MKSPLLSALCAGAILMGAPALAHAQTRVPRVPPVVLQQALQNDITYWLERLPPRHFAPFGNADRAQLFQIKGAILDKNNGFAEIPVPGDPNQNDVEKLQVKLYRANAGIVAAVSTVVWKQPRVPAELTFYAVSGNGQMMDVTPQLFPYKLETIEEDNKIVAYQDAYLPRAGTSIVTAVPETKTQDDEYLWNKNQFVRRDKPAPDAQTDN